MILGRRLIRYALTGGTVASAAIACAYADTNVHKAEHARRERISNYDVPTSVPYLLIGAGTASYYAALTIRARSPEEKVLIIGTEDEKPYSRTQLSKELWWYGDNQVADNLQYIGYRGRKKDVYYEVDGFYVDPKDWKQFKHGCISLLKNRRVSHIDRERKVAVLDTGETIKFDKCLIATGSRPRKLDILDSEDLRGRVHTLQTTKDFRDLDAAARSSKTIAIVGGGYLGAELAYSLLGYFKNVNQLQIVDIVAEDNVLEEALPLQLREDATKQLFKHGVRVVNSAKIIDATPESDGRVCLTVQKRDDAKEKIIVDHVIDATDAEPNVELAIASELPTDPVNGGLLADEHMRVAPDIYAAGDVSSFKDPDLGQRRITHTEHAEISGRVAGENMTNGQRRYPRQASWRGFVSPNAQFTALGKVDSAMSTVVVSTPKNEETDDKLRAVACYVENDKIVGLVLYNLPDESVLIARKVLSKQLRANAVTDVARLFRLYEDPQSKATTTTEAAP